MTITKFIFLLGLVPLIFISNNLFSQSGLDKTRKELLTFIKRPAYANLYPNINKYDASIVCTSEDGHKIVSYHFNKYGRCNAETYGLLNNDKNYKSNWLLLENYLKACGYEKSIETDNKYEDTRTRTVAYIELSGEFLITLFKKY